MTFPIHSHAAGKVFLAYMDESRAREVLEAENLERQTEVTITDPDALRSVIERVRNDGFAFDWDLQVPGMGTIADPIIVDDTLRAVLAVGCPTSRLQNKTYRAKLRQKLQEKVDSITIRSPYGV